MSDAVGVYLEKLKDAQVAKAELQQLLNDFKRTATYVSTYWQTINWPGRPGIPANMPTSMAKFLARGDGPPLVPDSEKIARCVNAYLTALIAAYQAFALVPLEHAENLSAPPD